SAHRRDGSGLDAHLFFFFSSRRRHTRSLRDWSSDVCSSDLNIQAAKRLTGGGPEAMALADRVSDAWIAFARTGSPNTPKLPAWKIGRASCRERVEILVVGVSINKKRDMATNKARREQHQQDG